MTRENAEASDWRRWAAWYVFITETIDNYCFFVEYGNWRQHSVGGFPPVSTELETHARRHWGFWPIRRWAASQSMAMTWCCTRTSFPRTRSVQSRCWKYYQDLQKFATLLWEGRWVKVSLILVSTSIGIGPEIFAVYTPFFKSMYQAPTWVHKKRACCSLNFPKSEIQIGISWKMRGLKFRSEFQMYKGLRPVRFAERWGQAPTPPRSFLFFSVLIHSTTITTRSS